MHRPSCTSQQRRIKLLARLQLGVLGWKELGDYVTLKGTVLFNGRSEDGDWILKIQPDEAFEPLLVNSTGRRNDDGIVECEVEPSDFFDDDQHESLYFGGLLGRHVTVVGTWCEDKSHSDKTEIHPITTVVTESTFHDKKRVYVVVLSDDSANIPVNVLHGGENRIGYFRVAFAPVPVVPHYDHQPVMAIEFEKNFARSTKFTIGTDSAGQPFLEGLVQSGTADENKGVYIARIVLSYTSTAKLIPMDVVPAAARLRISCVEHSHRRSKRGPQHTRLISAIGGWDGSVFWKLSTDLAIYLLRTNQKTFFVQGADGIRADVQIIEPHREGNDEYYYPYLATVPDASTNNNLSSLPECPKYTDEL
jgi:hypothetical protein